MYRELTVARVRGFEDEDHVEVLFLESARIYRLPRAVPEFDELLRRLQAAEQEGRAVSVGLASVEADVIDDVRA